MVRIGRLKLKKKLLVLYGHVAKRKWQHWDHLGGAMQTASSAWEYLLSRTLPFYCSEWAPFSINMDISTQSVLGELPSCVFSRVSLEKSGKFCPRKTLPHDILWGKLGKAYVFRYLMEKYILLVTCNWSPKCILTNWIDLLKAFLEGSFLQFQPVWYQSCTEASKESLSG